MGNDFDPAIAALEGRLDETEAKAAELRRAINTLCESAGMPIRYPDTETAPGGASQRVKQITDDTFYGKRQTPAMREYLEMRKAQGLGPATPRVIYEAIKAGGLQFETKDDETALVGLRALLRTQPEVFHKLPQGTYGLTAWYPNAKRSDDDNKPKKKKAAAKKAAASKKLRTAPSPEKQGHQPKNPGEKGDA